jgi:hypothetical protein
MRRPRGHKPDFAHFARAVTSRKPGPVPIGDIFADFETLANFVPLKNYLVMVDEGRRWNEEHCGDGN